MITEKRKTPNNELVVLNLITQNTLNSNDTSSFNIQITIVKNRPEKVSFNRIGFVRYMKMIDKEKQEVTVMP